MTKRGRVLRDTNVGSGLLTIDGTQYTFVLENMWASDVPPRVGMPIDAEFDPDGTLKRVLAVSESVLAREQANQALNAAKRQGNAIAQNALGRFGAGTLIGLVGLILGWFFLTTLSIDGQGGAVNLTFWQLLPCANSVHSVATLGAFGANVDPSPERGMFGLLAILALASPLLSYLWHDKRAALAGILPLITMLVASIAFRSNVVSAVRTFRNLAGDEAVKAFMQHASIGVGAYLSLLCCLYFAFMALRRYLVARA